MFFNSFLLFVFTDVCQIQQLLPFLSKIHLQDLLAIFAIFGVLIDKNLMNNAMQRLSSPEIKGLIFLLCWMVLSVPFSIYPGSSFRFLTQHLWKVLVSTSLILAYGSSREAIDKIIWAYLFGVGLLACISVVASGMHRFSITETYDPNDLALLAVVVFPFAFWRIKLFNGVRKITSIAMCLLIIFMIVATQSRGGFVGFLAVIMVIIFQARHIKKGYLKSVVLVFILIGSVVIYKGGTPYLDRILTIKDFETDYNVTSEGGRINVWKRALNMLVSNPLLGVGISEFATAEGMSHADSGGKWSAAHNSFLQVGAELGFPGLIAFCYIIWSSIKRCRSVVLSYGDTGSHSFDFIISSSIVGSWIGFVVAGSFLSKAYSGEFFFLLGLSCAYLGLDHSMGHDDGKTKLDVIT